MVRGEQDIVDFYGTVEIPCQLSLIHIYFIPTQKYKTNRIVFRMTGSLNKQTIAKRALVSQMLATANQTYPTVCLLYTSIIPTNLRFSSVSTIGTPEIR